MRLAGALAGVCGVRRRPMALIFAALLLRPLPQSSLKRGLEDIGAPWPGQEARLRPRLALPPATEGPRDGDDPLGTDHGGMVVKAAPDRLRMPHEAAAEQGAEARPLLPRFKACGRKGTAACADDSHSVTEALQAVSPQARLPADHCQTGKPSGGHLKKALCSSRRPSKASGATKHEQDGVARAKRLGQWRWRLRKQPTHVSAEAKQVMAARERAEAGGGPRFRSMLRQLGHSCAHAHRAAQAQRRLHQRSKESRAGDDDQREKRRTFFDDPWGQAWRYLRKKGLGKHRRRSPSASGRRRRRRREKNHDGIRSAATRQHYIQLYQAIKDLSLDIAELIEKGPPMTGPLRV